MSLTSQTKECCETFSAAIDPTFQRNYLIVLDIVSQTYDFVQVYQYTLSFMFPRGTFRRVGDIERILNTK